MNGATITQPRLTTAAIQTLLAAAVAEAQEQDLAVNISVYDADAQLAGFVRMHGAHPGAAQIAMDKAWTVAAFGGRATRAVGQALVGMTDATRGALLSHPHYTGLAGGVPIRIDGALVGSIGVAGAMPDQDERCAAAALAAIGADPLG